jgi:DNA polymerase-3 subunit alpha
VLAQYHEGLIATSACPGGVVSAHLVNDEYAQALEAAGFYREIFGRDFYIEIQNHGMDVEKPILRDAPKIARDLGLKLVGTNDCHYIRHEHAVPHNIMLLIPDASSTNTPDYQTLRYGTDQLYFKSAEGMAEVFREFPEAIASTLEIAAECNLELDLRKNYMPEFPIPQDAGVHTLDEYLDKLAMEGLRRRYGEPSESLRQRLQHELDVI